MRIKELLEKSGIKTNKKLADFSVSGIASNSKRVSRDFVFVAIRGSSEDGGKFISEAIERGARVVIVQDRKSRITNPKKVYLIAVKDARKAIARLASEFYGRPSEQLKVVGVTGTNGKTTITYLIEAIVKEAGYSPGVIGTINYRFQDKVIPSKMTTPGPVELEYILADMKNAGVGYCAMEVSSHALDQDRTLGINFHSAIFTNLTQDHLDYHENLSNYFRAKSKLFKNLNRSSYALINNDDPYARRLIKLTKAKVSTYAIDRKADVVASDIRFEVAATEFTVGTAKGSFRLHSQLIGKHNIYNMLGVIAWALSDGLEISVIKSALEKFNTVPGRLERIGESGNFSVFVDYAHTEDALKNIIQSLRRVSSNRIIVVFGCGGDRDKSKRPKMGRVVSELSDYAIITSDNPRSEDPLSIIEDIKRGIKKSNFSIIPERLDAIRESLALAKQGDIVLVAGKGHENYQVLADRTVHFDDKEAVKACLQSMK